MKIIFPILLLVFFCQILTETKAQSLQVAQTNDTAQYPYWIGMMKDPNANFFQTQRAFNLYWQDRPISKGCGWKPFKRWEYNMKSRILPDGTILPPDHTMNAYRDYMNQNDQPGSLAGNWVSQGPFTLPTDKGYEGLGRINAIGFHPTDPNILYIGAPAGGLWVTTVGGNSWTTTTDMLPTLGVSAVVVDPLNPSTIYIGTGDRDAGDAPGVGVMMSTDNGNTWTSANTGMGNVIVGKMLIDPLNHLTIFAATNAGVYKSTDGATTWVKKVAGDFKDLVFKPGNSTVLYAAKGGQFFRSMDSGESWSQITNGLSVAYRGVIGVTPANPELVYFLLTSSDSEYEGIYRSLDGGSTFTQRSNSPNIMDWSCDGSGSGGQAWYDLAIAVDPMNPDIVYSGGVDIWKSTNGGTTWQINAHWYGGCGVPAVHADQHFFGFHPLNNRLYVGNDGGIYWTSNGGTTWNEVSNGLAISQAYKLGQSATVDDLVVNGYQDNGTSIMDGSTWYAIGGGDGMECAIDHTDPAYRYTTVYYGPINRVYNNTNQGTIAGNGVNGINEEGGWVTPFIIDEVDPNSMFIGYKNIWRSENIKAANVGSVKWKKISTTINSDLDVVEQSPANTDILYASTSNRLYRCTNAHFLLPTFTDISSFVPGSEQITDIEAHPEDENIVYLTQAHNVYKSTDKGNTWTDITGTLPDIHINTIAYYKRSHEGLYVGSDAGVYYRENGMQDWISFSNGMPANAKITELEIYYDPSGPAGDRIKASTYGRGMWKSDMYFNTPVADFIASKTLIPDGCSISFKDLSTGIPSQWSWTFPGGQPSTSSERDPQNILYPAPGIYNVQLIAGNGVGSDTEVKTAYIIVNDTIKPLAGFEASPKINCNLFDAIVLTDTSKNCPTAWVWDITPNTFTYLNGTTSSSQNPVIQLLANGTYSISLTVFNNNGVSSVFKPDYIIGGGYPLPYNENFEMNDLSAGGWTIENPDNLVTWSTTQVSGNSPGNTAAWMNFYDYITPPGRRDRLISPPLNFSNTDPVFMTFDHAYASRYSLYSDSLIVLISEDCGASWYRIFAAGEKGQGTFATVPKMTDPFYPVTSEDWCGEGWGSDCYLIDLSQYANMEGIRIAFESYNRHSNNLFIDNIIISRTTGNTYKPPTTGEILLFPNPGNGIVSLTSTGQTGNLTLKAYNDQGRMVLQQELLSASALNTTIDLSDQPKGIYLIRIEGNGVDQTNKLVVQ
jgi:PKD repeat protein/photosystem II stability/assembly factor-like uncharacterized protein